MAHFPSSGSLKYKKRVDAHVTDMLRIFSRGFLQGITVAAVWMRFKKIFILQKKSAQKLTCGVVFPTDLNREVQNRKGKFIVVDFFSILH